MSDALPDASRPLTRGGSAVIQGVDILRGFAEIMANNPEESEEVQDNARRVLSWLDHYEGESSER